MTTTQLQLRRDTTANIGAITPAQGEPIYDVTRKSLALGDGATAGGGSVLAGVQTGSWTPTLAGATSAGAPTYTQQEGVYVKIGPLVVVWFSVAVSALGGMAGSVEIGSLPFASLTESNPLFTGELYSSGGVTLTTGFTALSLGVPAASGTVVVIVESGSAMNSANVQASQVAASAGFVGCIQYLTAF